MQHRNYKGRRRKPLFIHEQAYQLFEGKRGFNLIRDTDAPYCWICCLMGLLQWSAWIVSELTDNVRPDAYQVYATGQEVGARIAKLLLFELEPG